jgi:hypothetical protein
MKLRLSISVATGSVAVLSLLAACGSTEPTPPATGGTSSSGSAGQPTTTGGTGAGGHGTGGSSAGMSASGSAGHATGGTAGSGGTGGSAGGAGAGGSSAGSTATGGSAGAAAGTGGTSGGDSQPPTWDTVKLVLTGTNPPCSASDCHGPGGPNTFQVNIKDESALYTMLTTHISVDCGNIPVVTPGDPSKSALVKVLNGPCSAKVPQMPNGCTPADGNCVPADYIAGVTQWIANGAPH